MSEPAFTWTCHRCGAKRYGQTSQIPEGWDWRVVQESTRGEASTVLIVPSKWEARCRRCLGAEKPAPAPPKEPPADGP